MRVLVIDDDIPTTQVIKESIDWAAYEITEVFSAHNIDRARKLILEHLPEIVICDIEMPKGTGIELIKWVRENNIGSRFIFLTCHAEFFYASEAIKYEADAYVTKPFDVKSMEDVITGVTGKILNQRKLQQYKDYGERWMSNLHTRENSFWRELLFGAIPADRQAIRHVIDERGIECEIDAQYLLLLGSIMESQAGESGRDLAALRLSLVQLVNTVVSDAPDIVRTLDYTTNGHIYIIKVLAATDNPALLSSQCETMVSRCADSLGCELTCYISQEATVERLMAARVSLQEADAYNLTKRGRVLAVQSEWAGTSKPYAFNGKPIEKLIREERGVDAVNLLRRELENLAVQDLLNSEMMRKIQHDYLQIIYSMLNDNNIQAHELFTDAASQRLYEASGYSAFDMLKWASYITARTFQHIKNVRETESIVNKLKRFIAENYTRKLTREDIAATVFLSPDYVAKIFHHETGLYIKDFLNDIRISKARQLIKEGKMNVSEVAAVVGFENFPYFSSQFKKSTGFTPSEYKKREASDR